MVVDIRINSKYNNIKIRLLVFFNTPINANNIKKIGATKRIILGKYKNDGR